MLSTLPQPICLRTPRSGTNSLSLHHSATAAVAAAVPLKVSGARRQQRVLSTAAAAADAAYTAQSLDGIVPYINRKAPQLRSRHLASNPLQGLWEAAAKIALRGELLLTAAVDKQRFAPYIMAALAGLLVGAGLDASTLLQHGLPPYMPDLLLRAFGAWDTTLWSAALTVAALPVTAWALRAWWRANMQLLGNAARALQTLQQQQQQQSEEGSTAAVQQQQQLGGSIDHLLAAAVAGFRALCLSTAANSLIGLLYTKGASTTAAAISAVTGAGAVAAAVVSVMFLQQQGAKSASSSSSSSGNALVPLLAAEAALLAAVAGLGPIVSTAAAAVLGGSLYLLHSTVVAPALLKYKAAAGDTVEVHVGLKLAGTQPVFDSTLSEQPIRVQVGRVPDEVLQLWMEASVDPDSATEGQQDSSSSSSSSSGSGSEAGAEGAAVTSKTLSEVRQDIQAWMKQPMARWDALKPFVAAAAEGLYLGQTTSLPLYNPKVVGYWSPHFTWWQPIAEVEQKFKGEMPKVGDVFWYPVADGAAVPTRVNAIGQDYVELDANYGVTDTELELQVQLVRLQKPAQ